MFRNGHSQTHQGEDSRILSVPIFFEQEMRHFKTQMKLIQVGHICEASPIYPQLPDHVENSRIALSSSDGMRPPDLLPYNSPVIIYVLQSFVIV